MPRKRFNTPRKRIYYEYAKLIYRSRSNKWGVKLKSGTDYVRVESIYKKLSEREITPSSLLRENKLLVSQKNNCEYCGNEDNLQWEHIIPKSKGGPDSIDNMVLSCQKCNLNKGVKDLYEWYANDYEIPRIALGKHLKLLLQKFEEKNKLDSFQDELGFEISRINLIKIFKA